MGSGYCILAYGGGALIWDKETSTFFGFYVFRFLRFYIFYYQNICSMMNVSAHLMTSLSQGCTTSYYSDL